MSGWPGLAADSWLRVDEMGVIVEHVLYDFFCEVGVDDIVIEVHGALFFVQVTRNDVLGEFWLVGDRLQNILVYHVPQLRGKIFLDCGGDFEESVRVTFTRT